MYTPAELAEIAAADAELEGKPLTAEDYRRSRFVDEINGTNDTTERERERCHRKYLKYREERLERQRRYNTENAERIAEYRRENSERINARQREYYQKNREKILADIKKRRLSKCGL